MCYEFFNLLLLVGAQVLFSYFVHAKHLHQSGHIFDQNVVSSDHNLLGGRSTAAICRLGGVSSSTRASRGLRISRFSRWFIGLSALIHFIVVVPASYFILLQYVRWCWSLLLMSLLLLFFVIRSIQSLFGLSRSSNSLGLGRSWQLTIPWLLLLQNTVSVLLIVLLLGHIYVIFQILWVSDFRFPFLSSSSSWLARKLFIWKDLVGEENFMDDSIQHASPKGTREELLVWLRMPTGKNSHKFTRTVEFDHGFVQNISKFQHAWLFQRFFQMAVLIWVLFQDSIQKLVHLWIYMVIGDKNIVCTSWRDLKLATKRRFCLVTFVFCWAWSSTWQISSFGSVLDLVQTFLLPVKTFYLYHVECVKNQIAFDSEIKRTVRAQTWTQIYLNKPRFEVRVEQNIKSKHFIAVLAVHLVLLLSLKDIVLTTS